MSSVKPTADPAGATPPPARAPVAEAVGLTRYFRDFWGRRRVRALDRLSFRVYPGEVFGLLGPNGSGKSTAIKIMLGLLFPSAGGVRVFGGSPRDARRRARMGYMPEDSPLYPDMTAAETLAFYAKLFDIDAVSRRKRIDQLLRMIGLAHARRRRIGEFSRGMQRRIGLAQALINDPDLVILDEPTAGLDPLGCRDVKKLIRTLSARGKTVILTSHLLADVENVCDRIGILYNGRLRTEGRVADLLRLKERIEIAIPRPPPQVAADIRAFLLDAVGAEPRIRHPSVDLETFFLEVIETARLQGDAAVKSGATDSAGIAEYLAAPDAPPPRAILDQLVEGER